MALGGDKVNIKINGKPTEVPDQSTVNELLQGRGISPGEAVVQYNGEIVDKSQWIEIILKENDELEILRFVGGG